MKKSKSYERKRKAAAALAIILIVAMILSIAAPFFSSVYGMSSVNVQTSPVKTKTDNYLLKPQEEIQNEAFEIDAFVGIQAKGFDSYVVGKTTPFYVNIKNNGTSPFQGEVQLKVYSYIDYDVDYSGKTYGEYSIYYVPVTLAPQEEKQVMLTARCETQNPFFEFSLVDNQKKTIVRKNVTSNIIKYNTTIAGVLTDNSNWDYLKKINFNLEGQETKYVSFDKDTFPADAELLGNLQVLVVNDFNTKKLSVQQIEALNDWIEKGGLLIVGTGPNASKTLSGLESIIAVSIEGRSLADGLIDNNEISYDFGAETEIAKLSFSEDMQKLQEFSREAEATTSSFAKGNGQIVVHNFDLNLTPIGDNPEVIQACTAMYQNRSQNENRDNDLPYYMQHLADSFPIVAMSGVYIIFAVIIVYLIVIGPALYFILKKKDKRESGWLIIPVVAVIFTIAIFGFSRNSFYKNSLINFISVVDVKPDSQIGTIKTVGALKTPEKGDITFSMDKKENLYSFHQQSYYGKNENEELLLTKVLEGMQDKTEITYFNNANWNSNYLFALLKTDLGGTIDADITMKEKSFAGTVTNNTNQDFYDVVLLIGGQSKHYDSLKAGETLDVDLKIADDADFYSYEYGINMENLFGEDFSNRRVIAQKIKSGEMTEEEAYENRLKMQMLQFTSQYTEYDTNKNIKIPASFYAFNTVALLDSEKYINGKKAVEKTQNIYKMDFDIDLADVESFDIPYGMIPISDVYAAGAAYTLNYEAGNDFIYFDGEKAEANCSFELPQNVPLQLFQIDALWAENSYYQPPEIYNVKIQSWEKLSQEEYTNPNDYIGSVGQYIYDDTKTQSEGILIKIFIKGENGGVSAPRIRIKGGNENAGN